MKTIKELADYLNRAPSSLVQHCRSRLWNSKNNDLFFLMFHEIPRSADKHLLESSDYSITSSNFVSLIESLLSAGIGFCALDDIICGKHSDSSKTVLLTFDDVFKSAIENAVPLLTEKGIPFAVFVSECFIDKDGYLSSDDILKLRDNTLCTIGFHGKNHEKLHEIKTVDAILNAFDPSDFENKYNIHCKYYAYPYGSEHMCPPRVRNLIKTTDYIAAFGTVMSSASQQLIDTNKYYIPRMNISNKNWHDIAKQIADLDI